MSIRDKIVLSLMGMIFATAVGLTMYFKNPRYLWLLLMLICINYGEEK